MLFITNCDRLVEKERSFSSGRGVGGVGFARGRCEGEVSSFAAESGRSERKKFNFRLEKREVKSKKLNCFDTMLIFIDTLSKFPSKGKSHAITE